MLYLYIFHGSTHPEETLNDWGSEFGTVQIDGLKFTYGALYACNNGELIELPSDGEYIVIDGIYYGDFLVEEEGVVTMTWEEFKQKIEN